jgi:hypothetical protein
MAGTRRRKRDSHRVLGDEGAFKREDAGPDQNGGESPAKENGQRLIHRVYTVFNAKQIDGIPAYDPKQRTSLDAIQAGERILANSGARIEHDQRDDAGAQADSGRYNGRIIGETAHHVVQRLSPRTAVAHSKHLLENLPQAGDNVAIAYSNDHATVWDLRERVNAQELGR